MRHALSELLLLAVAALTGCDFAPIQAEQSDLKEQRPPTEDELLAEYGRRLAGSWTGLATVTDILGIENYDWMSLQWTPEPDTPRSGNLKLRCVTDGAACTPTRGLPGVFAFDYSLYSVTDDGKVRGALEVKFDGEVGGLTMFELKFVRPDQFEFTAPGGVIALSGTFDKDPPLLDAGTTAPPPTP